MYLDTEYPEIAMEWHPTKNGSLTPNHVTCFSNKRVWWLKHYVDPETGRSFDFEWQTSISNRTQRGSGCPFLTGYAVWTGFNDLQTKNPAVAAQWHPKKNGNLTPDKVLFRSLKKAWWLLPYDDPVSGKHFEFEWCASIASRAVGGAGCPYLTGKAVWMGYNDLSTTHPDIASQWHPTKNNSLTPVQVSYGSTKAVWWRFPFDDPVTGKHFDFVWKTKICNRTINGEGCPYVSGKAVWNGYNDLQTRYPELAAQWDQEKNGALKPFEVSWASKRMVWWKLPFDDPKTGKHFDFSWQASIASRTSGKSDCPYLIGRAVWAGYNDLNTRCPELARQWHPEKNGELTPNQVTSSSNKVVWWLLPYDDPISGKRFYFEWRASINARANHNTGCPYLNGTAVYPGYNDLQTQFPDIAAELDREKNGNLSANVITAYSNRKLWWRCSRCGKSWRAAVSTRTRTGARCPNCGANHDK